MTAMDMPADRPVAKATTRASAKKAYITWLALAMMTTSSVASLRPAPTMAMYGLACVFLYLVPAIVLWSSTKASRVRWPGEKRPRAGTVHLVELCAVRPHANTGRSSGIAVGDGWELPRVRRTGDGRSKRECVPSGDSAS